MSAESSSGRRKPALRLGQNLVHDVAMHIRQPELAALELERQLRVVEAEEMEQRCVQVMDVDAIGRGIESELIAFADREAGFHAAAREPHREGVGMVIAAVVAPLDHRSATKL